MSDTSTTKDRLERVREECGYTDLKSFWRDLGGEDSGFSYDAARTYHIAGRTAPAAYLARVSEVFGCRLEYLVAGTGAMAEVWEPTDEDLQRLDRDLSSDFLAGVSERVGDRSDRLLRGVRLGVILEVRRRFREHNPISPAGGRSDLELGRMVGDALAGPLDAFGIMEASILDTTLTDFTVAVCTSLGHLATIEVRNG